jgi:hypothetical protein
LPLFSNTHTRFLFFLIFLLLSSLLLLLSSFFFVPLLSNENREIGREIAEIERGPERERIGD